MNKLIPRDQTFHLRFRDYATKNCYQTVCGKLIVQRRVLTDITAVNCKKCLDLTICETPRGPINPTEGGY